MIEVGGGISVLILVPLLFFGAGVVFMAIAARDRRGGPHQSTPTLSARANHPLRHVQIALDSNRKQARRVARDQEPKPERQRRPRPPWLKRV